MNMEDVDAVISTISLEGKGIEYIQVDPLLTDEDCIRVGEKLSKITPKTTVKETVSEETTDSFKSLEKIISELDINIKDRFDREFKIISEKFSEAVNIKYIFYRFYDFGKWCTENANKSGGVSIIGLKKLSQYQFPIPYPDNPEKSLAIQSEIVRILDKFDTLTNSITEGLPREIELRQKQYEYYRDLLFSFPKPETVSN